MNSSDDLHPHDREDRTSTITMAIFNSTSCEAGAPGYRERSGQQVEVLRPLNSQECHIEEVGAMFLILFPDGVEAHAFSDELA